MNNLPNNNNACFLTDDGQNDDAAMMAMTLIAAAGLLLIAEKKAEEEQKTKRRCWVKDCRKTRIQNGNTQHLMQELKPNSADYKNFIRMDEDSFNLVFMIAVIKSDIEKQDTYMRPAISASEKLSVALRFLATGENFMELDYSSKLSKSFLATSIIDVCEATYKNLKYEFLKFPTSKEEWSKIADDYSLKWDVPNCLGAIDGKHVAFRPSKKIAPLFYNYKGFNSIVLLCVADTYAKFIYIDVGCNGRISDSGVLQRSNFLYVLQQPDRYLPSEKYIGDSRLLPHMFIGDNAFPLSENLITPYLFTTTDERKKIFNRRLSRTRQNIERAFGILSNRFQIFQSPINLHQDKVKIIVQCCCVLHNFLIERSRWYRDEAHVSELGNSTDQQRKKADGRLNIHNSKPGELVRQQLTEYFNNEGALYFKYFK